MLLILFAVVVIASTLLDWWHRRITRTGRMRTVALAAAHVRHAEALLSKCLLLAADNEALRQRNSRLRDQVSEARAALANAEVDLETLRDRLNPPQARPMPPILTAGVMRLVYPPETK